MSDLAKYKENSKNSQCSILQDENQVQGEKDLGKTVELLRKLLNAETNLHYPQDDEFLMRFIRGRKYNLDRAYKSVLFYFKTRIKNVEVLANLYPSQYLTVYNKHFAALLKSRDNAGRHIALFRFSQWNTAEHSITDIMFAVYIMVEEILSYPLTQIHGITVILDFECFNIFHASQITPMQIKRMLDILQDCVPIRFKAVHLVNYPKIIFFIYTLFKPFLKEKLCRRLNFHGNRVELLHRFISPDILPTCVGGQLSIEEAIDETCLRILLEKDEYYRDFFRYGYRR